MTGDTDPCMYPCTTLALPLVLGNVQQIASRNGCNPSSLPAARLASFTPLILQACRLHTTCPGSPHASHHTSCELHNTRPASPQASHHMSCMLHTTRPGSRFCFTPPVLQACMLHTIRPASFTPHVLRADFASHHLSCKLA